MTTIGGGSRLAGRYSTSWLRYGLIGRERILEGGVWTLAAYLISTGLVFTFVQVAVNRHSGAHLDENMLPVRTMSWLNNWATYGFARYGGLLIYSSDGLTVYKSHSGFYIWPLYAIEVVLLAIRGRFSYLLAALCNQSVIWAGAALIGWLCMRLTSCVPRSRAFLLGLGCALVYQTFPLNLMNFWFLNPLNVAINAMLAFWLAESYAQREPGNRWVPIATAASVLVLALSYSLSLTLFFLSSYVAVELFVDGSRLSLRHVMLCLVAPMVAVALFQSAQFAWVRWNVANVHFTGNLNFADFLWRSGLDGSTQYYVDHWSLLTRRQLSTEYPGRYPELVLQWKWLFIGGAAAVAAIAARYIRTPVFVTRTRLVFVATSLTCYALSAFVFSQGVTLHPDIWDVLLAFPLIIAFFCLLPDDLEATTNGTRITTFVWLVLAVCYVMVQLRTYAVAVSVS